MAERWVGLDIGGTKVLGTAFDPEWNVLAERRIASRRDDGADVVVRRAVELAHDLDARSASAIGVGFAGLVDTDAGRVRSSIMLPGWRDVPLADLLGADLDCPILIENDATAAGYGEFVAMGSPAGHNMVVLTVGTGIGGAILIDGALYRGTCGLAGEFGNMSIDWQGPECWCGSRGCLNMFASGSALADRADFDSVEAVLHAARGGDRLAAQAIDHAATALGAGIANVINIFNPDEVVLTGGVTRLGPPFLKRATTVAGQRAFAESFAAVGIRYSTVDLRAGTLGAAALARRRTAARSRS